MVAAVISGILLSHQSKRFELEDGTKHKHHTGDEDAMNEVETVLEDGTVVVSQIIGTPAGNSKRDFHMLKGPRIPMRGPFNISCHCGTAD